MVVMNLLIGVLCDIVRKVTEDEDEKRSVAAVHQKLHAIFQSVDANEDQKISKSEFEVILETKELAQAMKDVGVDPINLVDYVDTIFRANVYSKEQPKLTFEEFMHQVLSYRQADVATAKDVVDLRSRLKDIEGKIT